MFSPTTYTVGAQRPKVGDQGTSRGGGTVGTGAASRKRKSESHSVESSTGVQSKVQRGKKNGGGT